MPVSYTHLDVYKRQEDDLRAKFGVAFQQYSSSVPLFFPRVFSTARLPSEGEPKKTFSWQQFRRNREYKALIGTIGALAIVWLRMWLKGRYGY